MALDPINNIDMQVNEARAVTDLLLFVCEEASSDEYARFRACTVTMLYDLQAKLNSAETSVSALSRVPD